MKISDCLMILLHITGGIETYEISNYYGKLIKFGYVDVDFDTSKLILTDKGRAKIKLILEKGVD